MSLPTDIRPKRRLSLDEWAVIAALVLAVLVRAGILRLVPW
jgi:hypothetical protein